MQVLRFAALAAAVAVGAALGSPAQATVIDFSASATVHPDAITGEKGAPSILSFGTVDVFGYWTRGSQTGIAGINQSQQGRGVGLFARGDNTNENRGRPIDNSGSRDYLVLDLLGLWKPSTAQFDFRILSDLTKGYLIWGYDGSNGALLANDTSSFLGALPGFEEIASGTDSSLQFDPEVRAYPYLILSTQDPSSGANTQFYLSGLSGNELALPSPANALPEPGVLPLFAVGLAMLGFGRFWQARRTT